MVDVPVVPACLAVRRRPWWAVLARTLAAATCVVLTGGAVAVATGAVRSVGHKIFQDAVWRG